VRYDEEFRSIPNLVREGARRFGDAEALVDESVRLSYTALDRAMVQSVRAAMNWGVRPGDRIGLWAPNSAEWILAALGVLGAGGILVPLNTRWKGEETAYALDKSGATGLAVAQGFLGLDQLGMLRSAAPELPALRRTVVLDGDAEPQELGWAQYIAGGERISAAAAEESIAHVGPEQICDIMFTSGTTGRPKGVVLTHGQSLRAHCWLAEVFTFRPGDRYLVIPPFFHTFGYKAGWMASFAHGVTVLPQRVFDSSEVLQRIEKERITILLGPPTLFTDLMNSPDRHRVDLSSLRVTVPSAAIVPVELVHRLRSDLGFDVVLTAYGLTEATSLVTTCRPGDAPEDIARSVGRAVDDVEVIVVDDSGEVVPAGVPGEILVRGYVVMQGYWEEPDLTAEVIDAEGWLRTGDIGVLDERGFLTITDRKKDMIIVGGFNVYPAEIERVLVTHPDVAEVAVVGMPHERLGEVPVGFVVPVPGRAIDPTSLIGWAAERMANTKVPRQVYVVDELPRNASMKVLKAELRTRVGNS
jgi:acyl-CoA synthetase (AMP-forming)/AMP-acid ligase II